MARWRELTFIKTLLHLTDKVAFLCARRPRRVEHDGDDGGVVGPQLAHVPPVQRSVHQPLRGVQPRVAALSKIICLFENPWSTYTLQTGYKVKSDIRLLFQRTKHF